jgi:hypothetical protein
MSESRRRRKLEAELMTPLMPREVSGHCRELVRKIAGFLVQWTSHCSAEDRAAALLLAAFGEIARIDDPARRDEFLESMWWAHAEMVPAYRRFQKQGEQQLKC